MRPRVIARTIRNLMKMKKVVKIALRASRRRGKRRRQKVTMEQVRYLAKADIERFFRAIPLQAERDALLFDVMYHYALRREEATLIRREHVRERIWISRVKGGISREYPIFPRTEQLLWHYLSKREDENPFLFPSRQIDGASISTSLIYQLFQQYATAAELPEDRRFPHVLRHSMAVHLLNGGYDLIDVKDWLGHVSLTSTQIYARVSNTRLENQFRALRQSEIAAL